MNIEKLKVLIQDYIETTDTQHEESLCMTEREMARMHLENFARWVATQQPHDMFIERAAQVFGIKPEDVTEAQRKQIRALTFFTNFGGVPK